VTQLTTEVGLNRERVHAAQQMLTAFFVLAKTARVYETNNNSYQGQLSRFCELLKEYMDENFGCTVKVIKKRLFVDDQFVSIDSDDRIGVRLMLDRWHELSIGGLVFGDGVTPEDVTTLVHILWTFAIPGGDPFEQISRQLAREGVDSVSLIDLARLIEDNDIDLEDRQKLRRQARDTFFRAIRNVKEVMLVTDRDEPIIVSRTKRIVHSVIDQISNDGSALMELASIKNFDEYTYAHSVNVSIYALTLGFRLGLDRRELSELGVAALFHDLGKIRLPRDLVTKPGRFDDFDWVQMRRHPLLGAMIIAETMRLDNHSARAVAAAYEHHINTDGTGYPTLPEPRQTNLYSRIIAIADTFDAMTSGRIYIKHAISPDEVLRKMMYQMSAKFDSFLMKLFVNLIGIYPIGSLVLLTDKSLGIVTKSNPAEPSRPEVRLIADREGRKTTPEWFDLADPANRSVDVARCLDPDQYGINVTKYILSD
jgi:HD-GYP domain-containing protein (c-di-GMP phosphodiesterase class II)